MTAPTTFKADPGDAGFRGCYLTAGDGLRLYFRDYGPQESHRAVILALPGLTRNSKDFRGLAARYSGTRRVICPDYRGRGRSAYDPDWRHYEPRNYVEDMRHLLAALNIHRVVAVGTSLGVFVALGLALAVPSTLCGAVLNDAGPDVDPNGMARILNYIRGLRPQSNWEEAALALRRALPNQSIQDDADWLAFARATYCEGADGRLYTDWDPNIVKPLLRPAEAPADLWVVYRGIAKIPALAVRAGESDVLSEATFRRMKALKPDLIQVTVPGVGHAPSLKEPAVTQALDEFFARV